MRFAILCLLCLPAFAFAENTYDAHRYSCDQLQQIVKREKNVLLRNLFWGGRYVSKSKFCTGGQRTISNAYIAAADTRFCLPGLWCRVKFPGE